MILDRMANADRYRSLGRWIAEAFDYLQRTDFSSMADGRYELEGDHLAAIVQRYRTKPLSEALWEAHRRYIDIQYVVEGVERMGYAALDKSLCVRQPYSEAKDYVLFAAQGDLFHVPSGSFAVFGPQDIHAPGLAAGPGEDSGKVLKVVLKVAVESDEPGKA